jgi:hypothetical protein
MEILQLLYSRRYCPANIPQLNSSQLNCMAIFSQLPLQSSIVLVAPVLLFITILNGPHRKHPVSNIKAAVAWIFVSAGTSLPSRCPETVVCLFAYLVVIA